MQPQPRTQPIRAAIPALLARMQAIHAPANDATGSHAPVTDERRQRLFRALDDSMCGAGIRAGDMLVIRHEPQPASGEIVLAHLNGQLQIRRLCRVGGEILLLAEHPTALPRYVLERDELMLLGVVCGRFRLDLLG